MIIKIKKNSILLIKNYKFKCAIGKNGFKKDKKEGDMSTPIGIYQIGKLYYRPDKIKKIKTELKKKKIKKNMGWCNDPKSTKYNKEIRVSKKLKYEKLYRVDYKYNALIEIKYNIRPAVPFKGSAIFIHLTKNYKPTAGCIALKLDDFMTLCRVINKNCKVLIG